MCRIKSFSLQKVDALIVSLLFVIWLPLNRTQHLFQNATDALEGWDDLAKDAGYFTEEGRWKGGLPRRHRATDFENYYCDRTHSDAGFCLRWFGHSSLEAKAGDQTAQKVCNCNKHNDVFCQAWECRRQNTRIASCICDEEGNGENSFCQEWRCLESTVQGAREEQSFVCLHDDPMYNYCFQWRGNITAQRYVRSTVCDCYSGDESHCGHWLCEERTVTRCAVLKAHICDTGFAVGVYGGIGLVFLLLGLFVSFAIWNDDTEPKEHAVCCFLVAFFVVMVPMMIGVALTGGVYGIGWVFLLWGAPIFIFASYLISGSNPFKDAVARLKPDNLNQWKPGKIFPKTGSNSTSTCVELCV